MKINLPILIGGLLMTAILVAMLASGFGHDPRAVPKALQGRTAPAFALKTTDGEVVTLAELRGKPVIINFWSTWCLPCKQEHPLLLAAPAAYPDVVFLGVVYADEPAKVKAWLASNGHSYPQLLDPGGRTSIDYGVAGVPETYFVDVTGRVVHKEAGPISAPLLAKLVPRLSKP
jgi:cytochrome c biogenesis protein CcmG, thiol:disulfide interchange protein DsbE